jgi:hypothetical protein
VTETKKRAKKTVKTKRPVGRPRKFDSVARMQSAIDAYFDTVPQPWTVCSLGVHLNLTMEGLLEYQARSEFSEPIKKAKARIEAATAERMLRGDGWGPGHIFVLKNNYGWKDQAAVEVTGQGGGPIVMRFDKEDARL